LACIVRVSPDLGFPPTRTGLVFTVNTPNQRSSTAYSPRVPRRWILTPLSRRVLRQTATVSGQARAGALLSTTLSNLSPPKLISQSYQQWELRQFAHVVLLKGLDFAVISWLWACSPAGRTSQVCISPLIVIRVKSVHFHRPVQCRE
jgi:hypothetical protein